MLSCPGILDLRFYSNDVNPENDLSKRSTALPNFLEKMSFVAVYFGVRLGSFALLLTLFTASAAVIEYPKR